MSVENDFIPFAVGGSANVLSQTAYAALTSLTQNGFSAGIAPSVQLNKVWRQSSIMAAVIASFIVQETGQTAIDDGTTATLLANFTNAVNAASKTKVVLTDTGTANAYAAANPVPLTSLPTTTGFTQTVKIAHLNTGTSTYAPDGLATAPIYSLAGALLQGNELPVNGVATLVSFVDPLLNSGSLCWVLYECVGGAQPVAPATASQHAVQLGQVTGRLLNVQVFTSSATYTPFSSLVTSVIVEVQAGGGGSGTCNAPGTGAASCGGSAGAGTFARALIRSGFSGAAVTIGAAGAAGLTAPQAGGNGGTSSFGPLVSCPGGLGGGAGGSSTTATVVAGSSSSSNATVTAPAVTLFQMAGSGAGSSIVGTGGNSACSGNGGNSFIGSGGYTQNNGAGRSPASNSGAGASAAAAVASSGPFAGAAGGAGLVTVYEYA